MKKRKITAIMIHRELIDCLRFFWSAKKETKNIVFYAEHGGYYSYFEGIINCLVDSYQADICYITSDFSDPLLRKSTPRIKTFYINKILPYFMVFVNSRVLIMTMTDLDKFYIRRSINKVHYIYVFHSLISTHMQYNEDAFDHYDTILCAGSHHFNEIRRREESEKLPPKNLVPAGYYRLERIFKSYKNFMSQESFRSKSVVLVAPSWGKKNILELCGVNLVKSLLGGGHKVIVRPHPETLRRTPEVVSGLYRTFGADENFILEKSVSGDDSIMQADFLITDWSGIAMEYAFGTERPVLFLDVPKKIHNPNFKKLGLEPLEESVRSKIGVIIPVSETNNVNRALLDLKADSEKYCSRIADLRAEVVYNFGNSSAIAAENIISLARGT